jgi:hypothetical protein
VSLNEVSISDKPERFALIMEAARTSETSVNICHTTLRNIPADSRNQTLKNFFDTTAHYTNIRKSFADKPGPAGSNVHQMGKLLSRERICHEPTRRIFY